MRMTWERRKASPVAAVDRMHFVMWDFLKMFLVTVICGIAVSLAAAAITLVLSHNAYAQHSMDADFAGASHNKLVTQSGADWKAYPGVLLIGSGCDADMLDATDRDWKVTISGKYIDVRVMQTFVIPAGDAMTATFNASLPSHARLLRWNAHTNGSFWQGKVVDAVAYGQLTQIELRQLSRGGLLIVQNDEGDISTDAIINIAATEAVTIEYTYRIATEETHSSQSLLFALANETTTNSELPERTPHVTVWVEWVGGHPRRLTRLPGGAFLETAESKITGLSWTNSQRNDDTRLHLAWSM